MLAAHSHSHRAAAHILEHCAALSRLTAIAGAPLERVEAVVGHDLAHVLVHGLASRPARRGVPQA